MKSFRLTSVLAATILTGALVSAQSSQSPSNTPNSPAPGTASPTSVQPPPVNPRVQPSTSITQPQGAPVVPPVATPPTDPAGGPVMPLNPQPPAPVRPMNSAPRAPGLPPAVDASTALDSSGNPIAVSGASIDALAAAGVEAALSAPETIEALRRSEGSEQTRLLNQVLLRVDATSRALTELRAEARALGRPRSGANFDQLASEIATREDVLRDTLRNATISASEEDWTRIRHELATQYQAYAESVLRARQMLLPRR
jgi:hypothetical protein